MNNRPLNRIVLLLPVLGMLLASLFVTIPNGQASTYRQQPPVTFRVPDKEFVLEPSFITAEHPEQVLHYGRLFHCRPKALPLVWSLNLQASEPIREAKHTGMYVLRHTEMYEDIPTSSQYAYLFLLTPF